MENEAPVAHPEADTGTQDATQQQPTSPPPDPCCGGDCDSGAIDDLTCSGKRFQTQAEIIASSLEAITKHREDFSTARSKYQAALDAATAEVSAARKVLGTVIKETLLCHVKGHSLECLDQGLVNAIACVRKCGGAGGCCAKPCEFDDDPGNETAAALKGRIEQYRRDVAAASACFADVLGQITALPTRVAALKAEVDAIKQEAEGSTEGKDWARLYARAIVARWEFADEQVYVGFPKADALVDCLCLSLTCIMKGWEAIAVLEGAVAEMDCKAEAAAERCRKRRADMVGEVMCHYDRCCEDKPSDPKSDDCDDNPPPKKDCGCEGHDHAGEQTQSVED